MGDLCEVSLQDALLPQTERFVFLEARGWRVRMVRLRGVPSECLIMPLTDETHGLEPGTDITELAGVTKYESRCLPTSAATFAAAFPHSFQKPTSPIFNACRKWSRPCLASRSMPRSRPMAAAAPFTGMTTAPLRLSRNFELKDRPDTAVWQWCQVRSRAT